MFYTFPYLGIIFVPLMILYYIAAVYYRRSSVEAKRLDSLLRSALYSSYSGPYLFAPYDSIWHSQYLMFEQRRSPASVPFVHIARKYAHSVHVSLIFIISHRNCT